MDDQPLYSVCVLPGRGAEDPDGLGLGVVDGQHLGSQRRHPLPTIRGYIITEDQYNPTPTKKTATKSAATLVCEQ